MGELIGCRRVFRPHPVASFLIPLRKQLKLLLPSTGNEVTVSWDSLVPRNLKSGGSGGRVRQSEVTLGLCFVVLFSVLHSFRFPLWGLHWNSMGFCLVPILYHLLIGLTSCVQRAVVSFYWDFLFRTALRESKNQQAQHMSHSSVNWKLMSMGTVAGTISLLCCQVTTIFLCVQMAFYC